MAVCVPALAPVMIADGHGAKGSALALAEFAAGRFAAYLVIGIVAGIAGMRFAESGALHFIAAIGLIIFAALLLIHGILRNWPSSGKCESLMRNRWIRRYPSLAGVAVGFNVCPPLLVCVAAIVIAGSLMSGVAMAIGFAVGTTLFLLPLAISGLVAKWSALRRMAEVATLFSGLFFLCSGIAMLTR